MKILFDIGHPAHFHLFKNFIRYLLKNNFNVVIVARQKDILEHLLQNSEFKYQIISKPKKGFWGLAYELLIRNFKIFSLYMKHNFTLGFGTSVSIAHLSFLTKMKSYNFNEDDDAVVPLYASLSYPFSSKIINPSCLQFAKWKNKRLFHKSYHELAYLHPNNFKPDKNILNKYKLSPQKYIIVRYSALTAHHDRGARGINKIIWEKVNSLTSNYQKVISSEIEKTHQIDPCDMHHILAFAKMVISDSQTMTAEAAVLGIPSLRYNSFVGKISYLEELEYKYDLTYGFLPNKDEDAFLNKLKKLLKMNDLEKVFRLRKEKMLSEKEDLNLWIINYFNRLIEE